MDYIILIFTGNYERYGDVFSKGGVTVNLICVDNDVTTLRRVKKICKEISRMDEPIFFSKVSEAVEWMESGHSANIALLEIDGNKTGFLLAQNIRKQFPETVIILLSYHREYAIDALRIHASGYLLKPVPYEKLNEEIRYAMQLCHES